MKGLCHLLALATTVLLSGCAGVPGPGPTSIVTQPAPPATQNPQPPTPPDIVGNWQLTAASTVAGRPPLTFAGGLGEVGTTASGALHVDGSSCFDRLSTMGLTGTVTTGATSLTSTTLNGQVVTFTGTFSDAGFTGTYSVSGGCDAGDQGTLSGIRITLSDADAWSGTFTSAQQKFNASGSFAQANSPSSDGSLGITGTATFDTPCFSAQALSPGSFPSGSFLLGNVVSLQIATGNGTVSFVGTVDPSTEFITGTYNVAGGTCDQTGTAFVALGGQWDYH
jgi:hypothetical protein